jgi:phosphohistidine phosphatase
MVDQRTLLLLRHAKSDWSTDRPDERRRLSERGRRDAPAAGLWLRDNAPAIDLVVCSTAARARQTWTLAAAALEPAPAVLVDDRLYDATATGLLTVVRALPAAADTALLVAHNPGLSDLVGLLTGEPRALKTASIAVLAWPGGWPDAAPRGAAGTAFATPRG